MWWNVALCFFPFLVVLLHVEICKLQHSLRCVALHCIAFHAIPVDSTEMKKSRAHSNRVGVVLIFDSLLTSRSTMQLNYRTIMTISKSCMKFSKRFSLLYARGCVYVCGYISFCIFFHSF